MYYETKWLIREEHCIYKKMSEYLFSPTKAKTSLNITNGRFKQNLKEKSYTRTSSQQIKIDEIMYCISFYFSLLQAAKNSKPILLPVILMNGQRMLVEADTATTVNEICSQIAHRSGLKDRSGFSIYITLGPRVRCRDFRFYLRCL